MRIGQNILRLRKEKNQTQEKIAAELGVTIGAVSKWENNISLPDVTILCAIADYFGVTTDELLGRNEGKSFVVCDDAPFIRESIRNIMNDNGFLCIGLSNGESELSKILMENVPDILFLDIHYATENGLDILKKVKQQYQNMKVIIVTGDKTDETRTSAFQYGADQYITKPFLPEEIVDSVSNSN